jgi:Restriction endonuclease
MEGEVGSIISRRVARLLYGIAALAAVFGLVVDVTGIFGWEIDATAVGLIGVLLLVPTAEYLRKLKVGSIEAEFAEKVQYLDRRVTEITDIATEPDGEAHVASGPPQAKADSPQLSRTIHRIVWVDDRPEGNRLEVAELQRRFDVVTATSTQEGLARISERPGETAVITDAVRVEGRQENLNAGLKLLQMVRERYPTIPVYVYCGQSTAESYNEPLEQAGARLVTASFTELARQIRADARTSFEAEVATTLDEAGEVRAQSGGIDFVVTLRGMRVGIEAKDYRRTPKARAVDTAVGLLADAIGTGKIMKGLVVAPRDVFIPAQQERAPDGVQLVSVDRLSRVLADLAEE